MIISINTNSFLNPSVFTPKLLIFHRWTYSSHSCSWTILEISSDIQTFTFGYSCQVELVNGILSNIIIWIFVDAANDTSTTHWRHNERDGVSNHQPHDCLLTVYSGAHQRKHQSSASLVSVRGIHRWAVNSPHNGPVTRKIFPVDDVVMSYPKSVYRV